MGAMFRSEEMVLVELFIQSEAAHATVVELGELGMVQFQDLNPEVNSFQRHYVKDIRRCDEMERKLRFLIAQVSKAGLETKPNFVPQYTRPVSVREIDELDEKLTVLEEEIRHLNRNEESLRRNFMELTELKHVLEKIDIMFGDTQQLDTTFTAVDVPEEPSGGVREPLLRANSSSSKSALAADSRSTSLGYLTGIISRDKMPSFERVLWRTLRGNLFMRHAEVEEAILDPDTEKEGFKNVFVILSPGDQLQTKIRKICESFGATLYPSPESSNERRDLVEQVRQRMDDMRTVLGRTNSHRKTSLGNVATQLEEWMNLVRKEKAVFFTMNKFRIDVTSKCFIAQGWCPQKSMTDVRLALERAVDAKSMLVPTVINTIRTSQTPPTYFKTNKFTIGFQTIIDAYGIASYQEVNPAPFSLITFPFLFAVMFGDLGHGFILTFVAFLIVYYEKRLKTFDGGEIFAMVYGGRYIILLMGIFSMYTGLIYNDIFSKGMEIFESGWEFEQQTETVNNVTVSVNTTQIGYRVEGYTYPFGIDVGWHGTDNFLIFTNSYKMKMSVLYGVMQMTLGLILSLYNHIYFKRTVSIWNEFVPQMIFLQSIFGYLCITIIYKWCLPWDEVSPPSLLTMLINMFLSPGKIKDSQLYEGQGTVQVILLIMAVIAVPWMLLVKPFWLRHKHNKQQFQQIGQEEADDEESDEHEHFEFGEVFIHQTIHTIEFCLGCISNTASYLRLWALSLAHAQLSVVLWDMTIGNFISMEFGFLQIVGFFGGFSAWFALTICILVIMEGLSAFLHALRLHWVEFNNKFYEGSGIQFVPFSFAIILSETDTEA